MIHDPAIEQPICPGSTTVTVLATQPNAYVELEVRAAGHAVFDGRGGVTAKSRTTDVDVSVKLADGDEVRARQGHEGQPPSGWASAPVGGPPAPPAVTVLNDCNPGMPRFYRGQTVRLRFVQCGERAVAGNVRLTPPPGCGRPQFLLPLQVVKTGYLEARWLIPLHAVDAPPGEYVAQFLVPGPPPPEVRFSIGFPPADIDSIINVHNQARAAVQGAQLPPLVWSDDLAADAQEWANHLAADVGKLVHDAGGGENLAMWWPIGSQSPAPYIQAAWCDDAGEKGKFIAPCPAFGNACSTTGDWRAVGHYTQVVWGKTRRVGAGLAQNPTLDCEILALRYDPPGNVSGSAVFGP